MALNKMSLLWLIASAAILVQASDQVVLDASLATTTTTADPSVVSYYKSHFSHEFPMSQRLSFISTVRSVQCGVSCWPPACCNMYGLEPSTLANTILFRTMPTSDGTVTVTQSCITTPPPATTPSKPFPFPTTVLSVSPTRETLYRSPTATPEVMDTKAAMDDEFKAHNPSSTKPSTPPKDLEDVTSAFFAETIDGYHPLVLPLVIEDGTSTPLTILAYANVSQTLNFISSGLVSQLQLTSKIDSSLHGSLSSAQLSAILGFKTFSPGTLSLDVLAGANDRPIAVVPFVVYEADRAKVGTFDFDVAVGTEFLVPIDAIRISNEYIGVGAKEGLGVVVQRVFDHKDHKGNVEGHDEL